MKKLLIIFLFILFLVPSLTFADFTISLKYGSRGDEVVDLQDFLTDQGTYTGKLDGRFGLGTLKAVKVWQTTNDLNVDGYFGKTSRAKANEILTSILKDSNSTEQAETGSIALPVNTQTPKPVTDTTTQAKLDALNTQLQIQTQTINNISNQDSMPKISILTKVDFGSYDDSINNGLAFPDVQISTQNINNEIWIQFEFMGTVMAGDKIHINLDGEIKDFTLKVDDTARNRDENSIIGATLKHPQSGNDWIYTFGHTGHLDFTYTTDYPYTISLQRDNRIAIQSGVITTNSVLLIK